MVTNGAEVTFAVTATSPFSLGYQWQKNGTNLDGANNSSLILHSVTTADQATYRVVVTNQHAAATSADATLTVNTILIPPTITLDPQGQTNSVGGSVTFTVSASGTEPLRYQWRFNSSELGGEINSSLTLSCLSLASQGSYSVRVTNTAGLTNSQAALLTVLAPAASFIAYTTPGSVYAQDFNSLPNPAANSVNADNPVTIKAVIYGLANPFDFAGPVIACGAGLGGLGLSNTLVGWYGLAVSGSKLGASEGDQSTGGVISFGLTNSTDLSTNRALGLLATSSTDSTAFGVKLINQTTNTLTQMTLHFTSELWRQAAVPKVLAFGYWIDPAATGSFTTNITAVLTNLNVSFPANLAATNPVAMDGTALTNQVSLGVVNQAITNWAPGAALWLVWQMMDPASKGQGLAIDDLTFSASAPQAIVLTSLAIRLAETNVVLSWPGAATGYTLQVNSNLTQANGWSDVAQPIVVTNGLNTVTVPLGGTNQFFRLKQ